MRDGGKDPACQREPSVGAEERGRGRRVLCGNIGLQCGWEWVMVGVRGGGGLPVEHGVYDLA